MKKLLLASLAVVAFAGVAQAGTNVCVRPYASLKATYSDLEMDGRFYASSGEIAKTAKTDWVLGGAAAVGVKMCAFRTELEYNQSLTAKDKVRQGDGTKTRGDQSYRSYMLNGYFDLPTGTAFHPYGMAGLGVARIKNRLDAGMVTKNRETNFAWQVGGGIGYNLDKNWTLDVGYRYIDNGSSSWDVVGDKVKFDSTIHQITAGVRYTF